MDWNQDGKKDLIIGDTNGMIHIYLNTATDAAPAFSGSTYLRVGGSDFDCGNRAMPEIVDWNNDGKKDVLCGDDDGYVSLLINTGTNASPAFSARVYLQDGGNRLDAGTDTAYDRSSPVVVDWNADGKKDLLIGRTNGNIVYFENQGTDSSPFFSGSSVLQAGGSTLHAGTYARPDVADWNEDGQVDLLAGNTLGGVYLFIASPSGPLTEFAFGQPVNVLAPSHERWQTCYYNYSTAYTWYGPAHWGSSSTFFNLPDSQWIGFFLYSFWSGRWEEAMWAYKSDW